MADVASPGTAEDVGRLLHDHMDVVVPIANGEPPAVMDAIERAVVTRGLEDVQVHQMHALHDRPYLHGQVPGMRHVSYFLSHVTRPLVPQGHVDVIPAHFSEVPDLLEDRRVEGRDQLLVAAAGPDEDGLFSLGLSSDYAGTLLPTDVPIFLETNARMPFTRGDNGLPASRIAGWCRGADQPLVEVAPVVPSDRDRTIAGHVVERVPDGATLQAGIGAVPDAVLRFLTDHRDLGIHTELITDGFMDLVESEAVTNARKPDDMGRGVATTTFALGSQRLFDWLDEGAPVRFENVSRVNDPRRIAWMPDMVSINATTEIDFFGQCASETVNGRLWSGSGGQVDFARGAMYAGGQGFIVLPSTARDGMISRIRPSLTPGSLVTTHKNTVDHVVTEYGVASLRGRPVRERAHALIELAHPDFRGWLRAEARRMGIV